jgi:hypothetical protein
MKNRYKNDTSINPVQIIQVEMNQFDKILIYWIINNHLLERNDVLKEIFYNKSNTFINFGPAKVIILSSIIDGMV